MKYFLLILLSSCNKNICPESVWRSSDKQTLTFSCGSNITYSRPLPKCTITGDYQVLNSEMNTVAWHLSEGTCANDRDYTARCTLSSEIDNNDINYYRLSCQELGIHALFYK